MKKHSILAALLMLFALVLTSCSDDKKSEWSYFHGFTIEDIVGSYSWSNLDNAFDGLLESSNCHICDDGKVTVTQIAGSMVRFRFESELASFSRTVEDNATEDGNDFMIKMEEYPFEVSAYVYKNDKNQIRLHGFVRKNTAELGSINYYFDVIKD